MLLKRVTKLSVGIMIILVLSGFSAPQDNLSADKKKRWNSTKDYLESTTDALGVPIDKNIQDTVLLLNLLGIKTTSSCEGHLDWGLPHPWIDFTVFDVKQEQQISAEQNNLFNKQNEIRQHVSIEQLRAFPADHEYYKIVNKIREINLNLEKMSYKGTQKFKNLLQEFYKSSVNINYESLLIIRCFNPNFCRMQPLFAQEQDVEDPEPKKAHLKKYHLEILRFNEFLIEVYRK